MKTLTKLRFDIIDKNRLSISTLYVSPRLRHHLPFVASNGVTIATESLAPSRAAETPHGIVLLLEGDKYQAFHDRKPTTCLTSNAPAAKKQIRAAISEMRLALS